MPSIGERKVVAWGCAAWLSLSGCMGGEDPSQQRHEGALHTSDEAPGVERVKSPPSPGSPGSYLVGSTTRFVRDATRPFDPWNAIYGSEAHQALIEKLDRIGEPRTLVTEIWYPVAPPPGCLPARRRARPHCTSESAGRATYLDYYHGDRDVFDRRGAPPELITASGETVGELRARDPAAHADLVAEVLDELAARKRNSFIDAPAAAGRFPLVVYSHGGFTGNVSSDAHREIWTTLAEHLASHGYVVAAMDHTGDSRLPTVFHDGGSRLREVEGEAAVDDAYEVLFGATTTPEKITSRIFQPGGFTQANEMMRRLFEMRTADVLSVLEDLRAWTAGDGSLLHQRIDFDRVGVSGFSLGSMTTQVALSTLDEVETGMAWNNGLPAAWEPPGFDGLTRPCLFSLANQDQLSRTFFTDIPFLVYPNVVPGGEPSDFLFLEDERFFPPTRHNPEPVVRTAYQRADGPKLLLSLVDATHWSVSDDADYLYPRHRLEEGAIAVAYDHVVESLPFGQDVLDPTFVGEPVETMSWQQTRHGTWLYRPHAVRNYYSAAWFGLYLKGRESYRHHLRRERFGDTRVLQQEIFHR